MVSLGIDFLTIKIIIDLEFDQQIKVKDFTLLRRT